jgi:hypothetical protein
MEMNWGNSSNSTKDNSELETQFNEQKSRYPVKQEVEGFFEKYKQQFVFSELNEINDFYLLLNPNLKNKVVYDSTSNILSSRSLVEYTKGIDYNIKPTYINKFNHYKKFKYVLSCILNINKTLLHNVVLYDNPTLPIIDKPEPIDLETLVRPDRFPCNFEKVYNESDFSKYLNVHYHKIKNRHNLEHFERLNKDTGFLPLYLR